MVGSWPSFWSWGAKTIWPKAGEIGENLYRQQLIKLTLRRYYRRRQYEREKRYVSPYLERLLDRRNWEPWYSKHKELLCQCGWSEWQCRLWHRIFVVIFLWHTFQQRWWWSIRDGVDIIWCQNLVFSSQLNPLRSGRQQSQPKYMGHTAGELSRGM